MSNLFKYEVDSECAIYKNLCVELTKHITSDVLHFSGYTHKSKKDGEIDIELTFEIPFGIEKEFEYKNNEVKEIISVIRTRKDTVVGVEENATHFEYLCLSCKSNEILNKFIKNVIEKIHTAKKPITRDYIDLYVYEKSFWFHTTSQKKRSLENVYLSESVKKKIMDDVKSFIEDKDLYEKHGIPYKRSYLFTGPPGTGKTSFIYAIASEFNLNIGVFKMNSDKVSLEQAYKNLPKDTVMLIEDIEHFFPSTVTRSAKLETNDILNALDGAIVKNQLLTFMTSNNIDLIPKVMLRCGRVDEDVKFGYPNKEQIIDIHKSFKPDENSEEFYTSVKHIKKLTPAHLQNFLFRKPKRKINELEEIVNKTTEKDHVSGMHN